MLTSLLDLLSIVYSTIRMDRTESLNEELEHNLIKLLYILSKKVQCFLRYRLSRNRIYRGCSSKVATNRQIVSWNEEALFLKL